VKWHLLKRWTGYNRKGNSIRHSNDQATQENAMERVLDKHIEKKPGVCGGRACIAGHRIRVMDIVGWHEKREHSIAQVVEMFPGITRADVHAALAYYYDNIEEIESEFRKDQEWAQWAESNLPSLIPRELREKLGR
jgi:uncharacterized protein (DUF433 family)